MYLAGTSLVIYKLLSKFSIFLENSSLKVSLSNGAVTYHTYTCDILPLPDTPFHHWRIPGVLQRFSITYFVVAITELSTSELFAKWKVRCLHC